MNKSISSILKWLISTILSMFNFSLARKCTLVLFKRQKSRQDFNYVLLLFYVLLQCFD